MSEKKTWLGLEELHQDPSLEARKHNEFPEKLPLLHEVNEVAGNNSTSRRDFLKYLGFSVGAATLAASCEMPVRKAIPYVVAPDEVKAGIAAHYASTYADGSDYASILVKVRDGRPIKIEGNTLSNITYGGTTARLQGSILSLYDQNRVKGPILDGKAISWFEVDRRVQPQFGFIASGGQQIVILTHSLVSPSTKQLIAEFKGKYPTVKHVTYDPVSYSGMLDANEQSFGQRALPHYRFDKAKVIVGLGADFLGTWLNPNQFAPEYGMHRKPKGENPEMSRHIQFESVLSITGSSADVRVMLKPSDLRLATAHLYNEVARMASAPGIAGLGEHPAKEKIKQAAKDLWAHQGESVVVCGSNDPDEQMLVNGINDLLSNYGTTLDWANPCYYKSGKESDLEQLVKDMQGGQVGALIMHKCNPVFDNPFSGAFADAARNVNLRISCTTHFNESIEIAQYICPDHHYLESWSDAEPVKNHFSLGQPTIRPIFNTRQFEDSLLIWMQGALNPNDYDEMPGAEQGPAADTTAADNKGEKKKTYRSKFYDYIRQYWEASVFPLQSRVGDFQAFWDDSLRDGVFEVSGQSAALAVFTGNVQAAASKVKQTKESGGYQLAFYEKVAIGNGSHSDNPWLQEMPDPITRVTWDNYIIISPSDARKEDISVTSVGKVYTVDVNGQSLSLPVIVQPGLAPGTIGIALGYGRRVAGKAGQGTGKDVYPWIGVNNGHFNYVLDGATLTSTGESYPIAQTQIHHVINSKDNLDKRTILREGILPKMEETLDFIKETREEFSRLNGETLYPGHAEKYERGHHWNMAIDLNSCIGCGACSIACTAENNVPVVGKTEVDRVHEMQWIRIDRYYTGESEDNPDVVFQPMLCQHCDNAPCENVCPVAATNHSGEGLNQMIYNRCIGTRYCDNNCPYKVRRFNWYDWLGADSFFADTIFDNDKDPYGFTDDLTRMVLNPDVTVRSRGVMEKCSFCVQRIQEGKLTAKRAGRKLYDGDIKTACMQACPTHAITFGDGNDKESEVRKILDEDKRTYYVIEEINTLPSIGYQAKIRNRSEEEDMERRNSTNA